jgi:hypothetical protein
MNWPVNDTYDAQYRFMKKYSVEVAEQFSETYKRKRNELNKATAIDICCDSWDDTLAHIIGLGEEEYQKNINEPELIVKREHDGDNEESFSYCIPDRYDYSKLHDEGYEKYLDGTEELLVELNNTDEDDISPKIFRQFPKIKEVCDLLILRDWQRAVTHYHNYFGDGYADAWPLHNYCIPNFVADPERFRLRD